MYYSKNSPSRHGERIIIPQNYSGNAFRVKDESDRRPQENERGIDIDENNEDIAPPTLSSDADISETVEPHQEDTQQSAEEEKKRSIFSSLTSPKESGILSSLFHDIDIEDLLIFALVFMLLQDEPDDNVLLLLIILLLLK